MSSSNRINWPAYIATAIIVSATVFFVMWVAGPKDGNYTIIHNHPNGLITTYKTSYYTKSQRNDSIHFKSNGNTYLLYGDITIIRGP